MELSVNSCFEQESRASCHFCEPQVSVHTIVDNNENLLSTVFWFFFSSKPQNVLLRLDGTSGYG